MHVPSPKLVIKTVTDVLGGSSLVQNDTDRRLAASSTNGLPTMVYDGSDVMRMPLGVIAT